MFNKFFVLAGVGAVLSLVLTGCSTMPTTNEICLIENQRVNVDHLAEAVSIGLRHAGYEIKLLSADEDRSGCARCVEYGLVFNEKRDAVESVVFRSTKNGQRECLDFCVQGGFQGGSQSRLPFVYRGLKINDQRLRGTLSRRHKCAKRGECGAPSGGFHHTLHHSIAGSFAYRKSWRDSQERRSPRHP